MSTSMPKLDERWFTELRAVMIDERNYLRLARGENAHIRRLFLQDEIENPSLHYEHLREMPFHDFIARLRALQMRIDHEEGNDVIADLYTRKIANQIRRHEMLRASSGGDDAAFTTWSREIYGEPVSDMFAFACSRVQKRLGRVEREKHDSFKEFEAIVTREAKHTPAVQPLHADPSDPNAEPIPDARAARDVFRRVLSSYGYDSWNVVIDDTGSRAIFSVSHIDQTVYVPATEHLARRLRPLTYASTAALAEHEIGVHVRREEEALKGPLRLLEIGLDRYIRGEEGVAAYMQQQIEGADEYYGMDRYVALSLALGIDGEPRDFRSVYDLMVEYYILELAPFISNADKRIHHAADASFNVCMRIFRGTSGKHQGVAFTRHHVYFVGNIGIWDLLRRNPEFEQYLMVGKYDPLNELHLDALSELEILTLA